MTQLDYRQFLSEKLVLKRETQGFEPRDLNAKLFPFQAEAVRWACRTGKAALFFDCGLGKGPMALEWARQVAGHTGGQVLILAPLAVSQQLVREGQKFGIDVAYAREQSDGSGPITVTNYERLAKFDAAAFSGVVLDESSIVKNFVGKVKQQLFRVFAATPFKLACTATPAPNDHMELGQHAEFLDVLTSHEMLARWFINDTSNFGTYRLKGHAVGPFWDWVSSWARCAGRPSDLGAFDDDGYVLPPLKLERHIVDVDTTSDRGELLFRLPDLSATSLHAEKRRVALPRAERVARLVRAEPREPWIVWVDTDYEDDAVQAVLPEALSVRGSMPLDEKERRLTDFIEGRGRILVTKPAVAGFGLNLQHCARMVFAGPTFSFERFYQSIRRAYRFGQSREVVCHVVMATTEQAVWDVLQRKMEDHRRMQREMFAAARRAQVLHDRGVKAYRPAAAMRLPSWLGGIR